MQIQAAALLASRVATALSTAGAVVSPTIILGLLIASSAALLIAGAALASSSRRDVRAEKGETDAI